MSSFISEFCHAMALLCALLPTSNAKISVKNVKIEKETKSTENNSNRKKRQRK